MSIFDKKSPNNGEVFEILHKQKNIEITHIISSSKLPDILYCQDKDEFIIVLEGGAVLEVEGEEICLKKGEYFFIKAFTKHRILKCENGTHWLAVYMKTKTVIVAYNHN
ncbi:MAG: cupin domain-containing protein [Campylobacteraceae bacterium]|jgi:cupin 2 domain-containing protein|nr:cupin domain-containing protein [Campylobacteraceae bacterium]